MRRSDGSDWSTLVSQSQPPLPLPDFCHRINSRRSQDASFLDLPSCRLCPSKTRFLLYFIIGVRFGYQLDSLINSDIMNIRLLIFLSIHALETVGDLIFPQLALGNWTCANTLTTGSLQSRAAWLMLFRVINSIFRRCESFRRECGAKVPLTACFDSFQNCSLFQTQTPDENRGRCPLTYCGESHKVPKTCIGDDFLFHTSWVVCFVFLSVIQGTYWSRDQRRRS